jgi:hypothetical protein
MLLISHEMSAGNVQSWGKTIKQKEVRGMQLNKRKDPSITTEINCRFVSPRTPGMLVPPIAFWLLRHVGEDRSSSGLHLPMFEPAGPPSFIP